MGITPQRLAKDIKVRSRVSGDKRRFSMLRSAAAVTSGCLP